MARGDGAGERGVRDPRRTGAVYAIREPAPLGGSVVPAGVRWSGDFHDGTVEYLFVRVRAPVAHNTGLRCGGPGAPGRAVSIGRRLIEAFHLLLHPTGRGRGRMSRAFGAFDQTPGWAIKLPPPVRSGPRRVRRRPCGVLCRRIENRSSLR